MSTPDLAVGIASFDTAASAGMSDAGDKMLSAWTVSRAKRAFDVALVCAFAPVLGPLLLMLAGAVRLSSPGKVLFRQVRIGCDGKPFTILKFRTMIEPKGEDDAGIASAVPERITAVGRVLRRLKLDELPQVINVFRGEMSLVGPRPRIAGQQLASFDCRPGLTGAATLAFAREDLLLAAVPRQSGEQFYRDYIMPAKHRLDSVYMAQATLLSDVKILLRTALGRWEPPSVQETIAPSAAEAQGSET